MKKTRVILCIVIVAVMLFALTACGGNSGSGDSGSPVTGSSPDVGSSPGAGSSPGSNAAPETPAYTDTYKIIYATPDAMNGHWDTYLITPMMEMIEKYSNGRVTVEPYYSSTLAGQGAVLTAIDSGIADAGSDAPSMYNGVFLYSELANTPGIDYGSIVNYSQLINDYAEAFPEEGLQKYYMISRFSAGMFGFCTTNTPVQTPDSSRGLAFRATSNVIPYVEALGASGTFIPLSELYESLRLNVVDGAITTIDRIADDSYYDVVNYFTQITWFIGDHIEVLSLDLYNKMDPEAQAAIDRCSAEMMEYVFKWHDYTITNSEKLCTEGNPNFKFITLEGADLEYYVNAASGVLQDKVDQLNAAGLDGDGAVEWLKANARKYY